MLLVEATAGPSKMHGTGLIARQPIPKGTPIWRFQEGFDVELTREQLAALSPPARKQALHYGWYVDGIDRVLISSDDDRFTNHSENPNTTWGDDAVVATKDIAVGEEITHDYDELGGTDFLGWNFPK